MELINDDCLNYLETLQDNTLDLVITDPPYFIDKLDNNWSSTKIKNDTKNSHIKHLPKGMKFDKKQVENLYNFYLKVSKLIYSKLKPGGYFLTFSSPRLYHSIAMSCDIAGFEIRDMINWIYTQTMPKGMSCNHIIDRLDISEEEKYKLKNEYRNFKTPQMKSCFEPICVAMKPLAETNFIKNELVYKTGLINFSIGVGKNNDKKISNVITTDEFQEIYDKNFLISKPNKAEKGETNTHITVKPIELIKHLIEIFSKENSLVLDPFLGSGTTAVACRLSSRRCIGIEINEEYYNIALERVQSSSSS